MVAVCETEFFCNIFFGFKIEISLHRDDLQRWLLSHPVVVMLSQVIGPVLAADAANTDEENQDGSFTEVVFHRIHRAGIFRSIKCFNSETRPSSTVDSRQPTGTEAARGQRIARCSLMRLLVFQSLWWWSLDSELSSSW